MDQVSNQENELKRLRILSILIAILLGFLLSWATRYSMTSDALSYIDMADFFRKGDWEAGVRPSWCPLFPFLVGIGLYVLNPTPYWEFQTLHLINFLIYVGTIFAFDFFIWELLKHQKKREEELINKDFIVIPQWALLAVGYTIFIFCSIHLIGMWGPDPDMIFSAFLYLASGLVLKIHRGCNNTVIFLFLGVVLGLGYLAKTPMFILAFVYLGLSFFYKEILWKKNSKIFLAFLMFAIVSAPYITTISNMKGYFTFGESGKLNYAWYINDVTPFVHWQGEGSKDIGKPIHPTRKIFKNPPVYEFSKPIKGTYPAFYDPTYWYEGIKAKFDFFRQICAIAASMNIYSKIFFEYLGVFLFALFILYAMGFESNKSFLLKSILDQWVLLLPSLIAFLMFTLVHLEARYIAGSVVLFLIGLICSVSLKNSSETRKILEYVCVGIIAMVMTTTGSMTSKEITLWQKDGAEHIDWEIANSLHKLGVNKGDKVATIGYAVPYSAYWARLARVQIISEITPKDADKFWTSSESIKNDVINTIAKTGVKAIVTNKLPICCSCDKWKKIEKSNSYVYLF